MPFTTENIAAFESLIKTEAGAMLSLQQVDIYQGATVSVKLAVGTRRASEADLTAGASQDSELIATIDFDDWNTKVGREPQKGDVIWWMGKRHAVERCIAGAPGGNGIFHKARLRG